MDQTLDLNDLLILENELKVVSVLVNFKTASLNSKNKVKYQ